MLTAKEFALTVHAGQRYGNQTYETHLKSVVEVLSDFGYKDDWAQSGWLHDTLEVDLSLRFQIREWFGLRVLSLVNACTGEGKTRKARNASIYDKIDKFPDGAIVKMADRIANVEAAKPGDNHFTMYIKERQEFDIHVASKTPYRMQQRLNDAFDLRLSVPINTY